MAQTIHFNDSDQAYPIRGAEDLGGALFHLATLEMEEKTYMALAAVHEDEHVRGLGIVIIREDHTEDGTEFSLVQQPEELMEIIPRFFEAILPEGELHVSVDAQDGDTDAASALFSFDAPESGFLQ